MATASVVSAGSSVSLASMPRFRRRPFLCSTLFLFCDLLAIAATGTIVLFARPDVEGLDIHRYLALWPALVAVVITFACSHLYPGIIHNAVDELRRVAAELELLLLL